MDEPKPDKKKMAMDAESIAEWLARDTGHEETGYADEQDETEPQLGLPQMKHENLRKFFDGLHVEKDMAERRKQKATEAVDMADELNKAIGPVAPKPMGGGY